MRLAVEMVMAVWASPAQAQAGRGPALVLVDGAAGAALSKALEAAGVEVVAVGAATTPAQAYDLGAARAAKIVVVGQAATRDVGPVGLVDQVSAVGRYALKVLDVDGRRTLGVANAERHGFGVALGDARRDSLNEAAAAVALGIRGLAPARSGPPRTASGVVLRLVGATTFRAVGVVEALARAQDPLAHIIELGAREIVFLLPGIAEPGQVAAAARVLPVAGHTIGAVVERGEVVVRLDRLPEPPDDGDAEDLPEPGR